MWTPAKFTEWSRDPMHPFYDPNQPHDSNQITFMLDGAEIKPERVAVASVNNRYLRLFTLKAGGAKTVEKIGKLSRLKTHIVKGRVTIMVRAEDA